MTGAAAAGVPHAGPVPRPCVPCGLPPPRLLIVPGLHDSGPAHWQSWLQALHRGSIRVQQDDWHTPDLARWSARIADTLADHGPGPWTVVAHSFGCLALAHHLALRPSAAPVLGTLLVAPAEPDRFGLAHALPQRALPVPSTLLASETDPWMSADSARRWAQRWGSHWVNLGDVGHINAEAGFGPLPYARRWVLAVEQQRVRQARGRRPSADDRAAARGLQPPAWRWAV